MTSKLKCPFCGEEIVGVPNLAQTRTIGFRCYNIQCKAFNHFMPVFILQALIQAKQDLEIVRSALEDIKSDYELYSEQGCRMEPNETDMYNYARTALEQIDHFADVSKMIEHKE